MITDYLTSMEVRLVKTPEEKEAVYRLRYQVYVEEMGLDQFYADHLKKNYFRTS
jgi:N-acyl-L-homoserine lactone synthetase